MRLAGKIASITGAGRGIGRGIAEVFADVSKRAAVEPMVDDVWRTLGPIDILVNNAGIETIVPFLDLTDEQWTRLTDVNLRGAWLCSQVFCRRAVAATRPLGHRRLDQPRVHAVNAGQPREIGAVTAFIASDEAGYVTGQSLHVDGGWAGK